MPFYTWLRPRRGEDADTRKTKQRAARKTEALRAALEAHIDAASLPEDTEPPSDSSKFVRIAMWNIFEFDSPSYGYRTQEAKAYIAEPTHKDPTPDPRPWWPGHRGPGHAQSLPLGRVQHVQRMGNPSSSPARWDRPLPRLACFDDKQ